MRNLGGGFGGHAKSERGEKNSTNVCT
jgi:hypothetical protein